MLSPVGQPFTKAYSGIFSGSLLSWDWKVKDGSNTRVSKKDRYMKTRWTKDMRKKKDRIVPNRRSETGQNHHASLDEFKWNRNIITRTGSMNDHRNGYTYLPAHGPARTVRSTRHKSSSKTIRHSPSPKNKIIANGDKWNHGPRCSGSELWTRSEHENNTRVRVSCNLLLRSNCSLTSLDPLL